MQTLFSARCSGALAPPPGACAATFTSHFRLRFPWGFSGVVNLGSEFNFSGLFPLLSSEVNNGTFPAGLFRALNEIISTGSYMAGNLGKPSGCFLWSCISGPEATLLSLHLLLGAFVVSCTQFSCFVSTLWPHDGVGAMDIRGAAGGVVGLSRRSGCGHVSDEIRQVRDMDV